ncbi:hypothetical protein QFC21_005811 [Naganishia friedmannii]|uniref:Uncharacterized protein n=1 Tax=Naganishia friedmannii TaxID=89922 RepID=A0ACC2V6P3_9TREE|nr:hypothetical protein QFC21_005811 [Naganishia friedmannii]
MDDLDYLKESDMPPADRSEPGLDFSLAAGISLSGMIQTIAKGIRNVCYSSEKPNVGWDWGFVSCLTTRFIVRIISALTSRYNPTVASMLWRWSHWSALFHGEERKLFAKQTVASTRGYSNASSNETDDHRQDVEDEDIAGYAIAEAYEDDSAATENQQERLADDNLDDESHESYRENASKRAKQRRTIEGVATK